MRGKAVIVLAVVFAFTGVVAGGDAKTEMKRFAGTWSVVSVQRGGKEAPADAVGDIRLTFTGNKVSLAKGDKSKNGTFKIDPTRKPKQIDLMLEGKTAEGIYQFKGKMLELCIGEPGEARPGEFKAPAGTSITVVVLKRTKN